MTNLAATSIWIAPAETPRADWDALVAALASKQHGVVSRRQLLAAGISPAGIRHRLERKRLHEIHPGVYAVGHRLLAAKGWWMAAVLAGGDGAVLSHRAAAALQGLIFEKPEVIDVLVLRTTPKRRGLRPRRVRSIPPEDRTVVDGIPCTSLPRTLLDLASVTSVRRTDRALRRAEELRVFDRAPLEAILKRGRPGTPVLRTAMGVFMGDERVQRKLKSELELRFLELLRAHRFVLPSTNVVVPTRWGAHEVDTLWPEHRIVIELDGWWAHLDRESFQKDHRRAVDVQAMGYEVARLTWDQVVDHGKWTVERLVRILPRETTPARPARPPRVPG